MELAQADHKEMEKGKMAWEGLAAPTSSCFVMQEEAASSCSTEVMLGHTTSPPCHPGAAVALIPMEDCRAEGLRDEL